MSAKNLKALLFANTDWYLYNFRLPLARTLREKGWEVVLVSPPGGYSHFLLEEGFRWISFPFSRRGVNLLEEGDAILRLRTLYRREKPDVFHNFTIKCILYGSIAGGLLGNAHDGRASIINAVTGLGYAFTGKSLPRRLLQRFVQLLYRLVLKKTWIIFQNPEDQAFFLDQRVANPQRSFLIPGSGVDLDHFSPQPEPTTPDSGEKPIAAFVGRLLRDKGVVEFVEAARSLKLAGTQARFVLIGSTDLDNPGGISSQTIDNWVNEEVVEWWGWQTDMLPVYAQANIICLPSYREGMPRVLAEAAACARALVASDVPGCREIIQDGENGFLVPPRDSHALAEALKKLIENPGLRRQMGLKSRVIVENGFSVESVINETLAIYELVIR